MGEKDRILGSENNKSNPNNSFPSVTKRTIIAQQTIKLIYNYNDNIYICFQIDDLSFPLIIHNS